MFQFLLFFKMYFAPRVSSSSRRHMLFLGACIYHCVFVRFWCSVFLEAFTMEALQRIWAGGQSGRPRGRTSHVSGSCQPSPKYVRDKPGQWVTADSLRLHDAWNDIVTKNDLADRSEAAKLERETALKREWRNILEKPFSFRDDHFSRSMEVPDGVSAMYEKETSLAENDGEELVPAKKLKLVSLGTGFDAAPSGSTWRDSAAFRTPPPKLGKTMGKLALAQVKLVVCRTKELRAGASRACHPNVDERLPVRSVDGNSPLIQEELNRYESKKYSSTSAPVRRCHLARVAYFLKREFTSETVGKIDDEIRRDLVTPRHVNRVSACFFRRQELCREAATCPLGRMLAASRPSPRRSARRPATSS